MRYLKNVQLLPGCFDYRYFHVFQCTQRDSLRFRNSLLRLEWEKLKQMLSVEKGSAHHEQDEILHRKEELKRRREELAQHICEMKILHDSHVGHR